MYVYGVLSFKQEREMMETRIAGCTAMSKDLQPATINANARTVGKLQAVLLGLDVGEWPAAWR